MSDLNLTSVISKKAELLSSEVDGEVVMMNIETGRYIGMNHVGSEIWKILEEGPLSVNQICKELLLSYKIDQTTCEQEALSFCNQMLKEKLIELN